MFLLLFLGSSTININYWLHTLLNEISSLTYLLVSWRWDELSGFGWPASRSGSSRMWLLAVGWAQVCSCGFMLRYQVKGLELFSGSRKLLWWCQRNKRKNYCTSTFQAHCQHLIGQSTSHFHQSKGENVHSVSSTRNCKVRWQRVRIQRWVKNCGHLFISHVSLNSILL